MLHFLFKVCNIFACCKPLFLMSLIFFFFFYHQGDANRSYSDDDHSSSNFDESEKHDSIKLSGENLNVFFFPLSFLKDDWTLLSLVVVLFYPVSSVHFLQLNTQSMHTNIKKCCLMIVSKFTHYRAHIIKTVEWSILK